MGFKIYFSSYQENHYLVFQWCLLRDHHSAMDAHQLDKGPQRYCGDEEVEWSENSFFYLKTKLNLH